MKLQAKLGIFTLAIITLVILILSYSLFVYQKHEMHKDMNIEQEIIFKTFNNLSIEALLLRDELLLVNDMRALKTTYRGIEYINFMLTGGRVLPTDKDMEDRARLKKDIQRLEVEQYNAGFNKLINEISGPVYFENDKLGVGQIGFSQRYYDKYIAEKIRRLRKRIIIIALLSLVLGFLCSMLISRAIAEPIKKLAQGANAIGNGHLDTQIEVNTRDELGMLAEEFNQMADRLAEVDRAKDDFVNAVSHELRTPLSAIEGYIDFLIEAGEGINHEKRQKALNIMKSSSRRLAQFINDVLDIAKIKSTMMNFELESHPAKPIIEKVTKLLVSVAQQKGIILQISVPDNVPPVIVDEARISQVFTNLIGNALKFTPEGGSITVGAEYLEKGTVRMYVKDTGPGIPEADLRKIFAQFEQSKSTRNIKGPKGTGLGLAIAEGIVNSHGGRIWVESEVGIGTTFYFTLKESENNV